MTATTAAPGKLREAIRRRSSAASNADALPETPPDWRDHAVQLLACPGLDPADGAAIRAWLAWLAWLAWRALPRRYWAKLEEVAARMEGRALTLVPPSEAASSD